MDTKEMVDRLAPLARTDTRRIDYGDRFAFLSAFVYRAVYLGFSADILREARKKWSTLAFAAPAAGLSRQP